MVDLGGTAGRNGRKDQDGDRTEERERRIGEKIGIHFRMERATAIVGDWLRVNGHRKMDARARRSVARMVRAYVRAREQKLE